MQLQKQSVSPRGTKTTDNPVVERLSNQQKELNLRISYTVNNERGPKLKTQRNRIFHDIADMLNEGKNRELNNLAS